MTIMPTWLIRMHSLLVATTTRSAKRVTPVKVPKKGRTQRCRPVSIAIVRRLVLQHDDGVPDDGGAAAQHLHVPAACAGCHIEGRGRAASIHDHHHTRTDGRPTLTSTPHCAARAVRPYRDRNSESRPRIDQNRFLITCAHGRCLSKIIDGELPEPDADV